MSNRSVDRKSSSSVGEAGPRPRLRELEAVRHLVQRHERAEVGRHRATSRPRTGARWAPRTSRRPAPTEAPPRRTVRAPAARGTRAPARPGRPSATARSAPACRSSPASQAAGRRAACEVHRLADARCAAGSSRPARFSVFAPIHSARRTARTSATSMGGFEPGEPRDVQLGDAHGFLEAVALVVGGVAILARLGGARDGDLPRELPVHGAGRGRHHALHLAEQRRVAQRLRIHAEGEPEPAASLVAHEVIVRPLGPSALVTMAACPTCEPAPSPTRVR